MESSVDVNIDATLKYPETEKLIADWWWEPQSITNMQHKYRIRDEEVKFKLPKLRPQLFSGDNVDSICGPMKYTFSPTFPDIMDVVVNATDSTEAWEVRI